MIMKYKHFILAAFFLSGTTSCNSSTKSEDVKESAPVATSVEDTTATGSTAPAEKAEADEQETQAQKAFLEAFYDGLDEDFEPEYVAKFITPNAKKILVDEYDYDCETGDCLAVWLFAYEGGGDTGPCLSRSIKPQGANKFLVTSKYEEEEYNVVLTLIKEGDTYKIDDIKKGNI